MAGWGTATLISQSEVLIFQVDYFLSSTCVDLSCDCRQLYDLLQGAGLSVHKTFMCMQWACQSGDLSSCDDWSIHGTRWQRLTRTQVYMCVNIHKIIYIYVWEREICVCKCVCVCVWVQAERCANTHTSACYTISLPANPWLTLHHMQCRQLENTVDSSSIL